MKTGLMLSRWGKQRLMQVQSHGPDQYLEIVPSWGQMTRKLLQKLDVDADHG